MVDHEVLAALTATLGAVGPLGEGLRLLAGEAGEELDTASVLAELAALTGALLRGGDEREEDLEAVFAALEALAGMKGGAELAASFLAELDPEALALADGYLHPESALLLALFPGERRSEDRGGEREGHDPRAPGVG